MPPKATAKINGKVIAESDQYETVEGNIYVSIILLLLYLSSMRISTNRPLYGSSRQSEFVKQLPVAIADPVESSAINRECLRLSQTQKVCGWKGKASYYDIEIDGTNLQIHLAAYFSIYYSAF